MTAAASPTSPPPLRPHHRRHDQTAGPHPFIIIPCAAPKPTMAVGAPGTPSISSVFSRCKSTVRSAPAYLRLAHEAVPEPPRPGRPLPHPLTVSESPREPSIAPLWPSYEHIRHMVQVSSERCMNQVNTPPLHNNQLAQTEDCRSDPSGWISYRARGAGGTRMASIVAIPALVWGWTDGG